MVSSDNIAIDQLAGFDVTFTTLRLDDERVLAESLFAKLDRNDFQALQRNDTTRVFVLQYCAAQTR
jgi:hypothetical protein